MEDNLKIAIAEKELAKNLIVMAKIELDRAKARDNFTKQESKLAKQRDKLAKTQLKC